MTQEEKAKAYDKAMDRAKKELDTCGSQNCDAARQIFRLFPELKESEDERILEIIKHCIESRYLHTSTIKGISQKECFAWLEKQKVTDEEIIFRPVVGTDIRIAAKQALEKIDTERKVVLAFNGAYIPVNGKTVGEIDSEYDAWLEKQGEQKNKINSCKITFEDVLALECSIKIAKITKGGDELYKILISLYNKIHNAYLAEKQGKQNPHSGVSFEYNGHTWGMCARDGGVEILMDGNLKAFVSLDKSFIYPVNPTPLLKDENFYVSKDDGLLHDNAEPKFHEGDWVVQGNIVAQILDVQEQYYVGLDTEGNDFTASRFLSDDKIHLWTIQDAKDGDFLYIEEKEENYECKWILKFKGIEKSKLMTYSSLAGNNNFCDEGPWGNVSEISFVRPAKFYERKELIEKMKDNKVEEEYDD